MSGVANGKTRVQITFGDELLRKVDNYCEETGITRSSLVCAAVADKLGAYDQVMRMAGDAINSIVSDLEKG